MRVKRSFLYKRIVIFACAASACLLLALLALNFFKIFAEPLGDEARVNENDQLTYYITVNSDGIDHESIESSDSQIADEVSGITTVTDVLPDGLTFEGFVTSPDGSFGAVQRDDKATQCAGRVIDDTNEEGVDSGVWNADNTEYTYHGLHYDAATRKVSFRTKGIGAGCELTVGVITRTPTLPDGVFRMDFYDHAKFVDESLFGDSNTVHAWIQKDTLPGEFSLSYRYDGVVPENAPALPQTSYYDESNAEIAVADKPTMDGYTFDGWYYDMGYNTKSDASLLTQLPGKSLVVYGEWVPDGGEPVDTDPEKYDVVYEIEGTKPTSFNVPAKRSYYEGASVELDDTKNGANFDGYDFSGWNSEDVDAGATTFSMPSKNVTLRGSFDRESYTVSYAYLGDVKPENADSMLPAASEHYAGDMITLAGAVSAEGYTFSGWMADPNFEMPAKDVVIYGEWVKDKIEFTPGIAIEITNPENEYHKGDVVKFKITITNEESFDLDNVWLEELLEGAVFVPGDGYSVEQGTFAKIDKVPAGGSASVYAEFEVTKNIEKLYTNEVELISADISNPDYTLPEDWENKASVDFAVGIISDLPVDPDEPVQPDEKEETPKTFDGIVKAVVSGMVLTGGLAACVYIMKNRRSGIKYGYMTGIVVVAGVTVLAINNGLSFADNNTERTELDIYSTKLNYDNGDAGAWKVHESAKWVGVGEAALNIQVESNRISDLHNKDVILILDNSNWTAYAIDGTEPDDETDELAIDIMKRGASDFVKGLLKDGDSRIVVMQTWGDISSELTNDVDEAKGQIAQVMPTSNTNYNSYSETYDKLLSYLDYYLSRDDISGRSLNIVYVSDDHVAVSGDIAKYKMLKKKAPEASVAGIGFGVREIGNERYVSASTAEDLGVCRWWVGIDGNLMPVNAYEGAINGLDKITNWHSNPWKEEYVSDLTKAVDGAQVFDKFNIETQINLEDFEIKGIFGENSEITVSDGKINWKNENGAYVSGISYSMNVLLRAKDETIEKHKLYSLNSNTVIETDAVDIEADSVSESRGLVLMNGYELNFDINNSGTCSLGNNTDGGIYWAFQTIVLDEEGVSCEGWNFDSFKNADEEGLIYSYKNNKMPSSDMTLKATWRKIDVEVHMDGQIYSVAPAILMDGMSFNKKLYGIYPYGSDVLIRAEGCPRIYMDEAHRISADDSVTKIYAWKADVGTFVYESYYEPGQNYYYSSPIIQYCSDSDVIKLNEDSTAMFGNYSYYDKDNNYQRTSSGFRMLDDSVSKWDASDVKDMSHMFHYTNLGRVPIKRLMDSWDTSNVETMDYTFAEFGNLRYGSDNFDYDNFLRKVNTSNVKSMIGTFWGSDYLHLWKGLEDWDVSNVENMEAIFSQNEYTSDYDMLANWDVSNVKNMKEAFRRATASYRVTNNATLNDYVDFKGIADWDTSNVTNMERAFYLANVKRLECVGRWNVSKVESMVSMFELANVASGMTAVGEASSLSAWKVNSLKDATRMFEESNVTSIAGFGGWGKSTSNIEHFDRMFYKTKIANTNGLQAWDTSGAKTMTYMFASDRPDDYTVYTAPLILVNIDGSSTWDVSNVTNMEGMFLGANPANLNALSRWDVSSVENMAYMFCGATSSVGSGIGECVHTFVVRGNNGATKVRPAYGGPKALTGIENWNLASLKNMTGMFAGGEVTDLSPLNGWDVSGVEDMTNTFAGLRVNDFTGISNWKTDSLKTMKYMFRGSSATSLEGLNDWNVSTVTDMTGAFGDMLNLSDITALSDWDTVSLTHLDQLLMGHKSLTSLSGLENWDVSKATSLQYTFGGFSPYDGYSAVTNWASYSQSTLTDVSALANWDLSSARFMNGFLSANGLLVDISPLAGFRLENVTDLGSFFVGDKGITSLDALEHWYDNADSLEQKHNVDYSFTFAYMTGLRDVSALSNWTSSKINPSSISSMMRSDSRVSSFTALNNTFFNKTYSASEKSNAFDNTSGTRPSWY